VIRKTNGSSVTNHKMNDLVDATIQLSVWVLELAGFGDRPVVHEARELAATLARDRNLTPSDTEALLSAADLFGAPFDIDGGADAAHVSDVLDDGGVNAASVAPSAVVAKEGSSEADGSESMHHLLQQSIRDFGSPLVMLAVRLVGYEDAEDVVQEAFVRLAIRIRRKPLAETMTPFRSREDLWRLICRDTACLAYNRLRRRQSRADDPADAGVERLETSTPNRRRELTPESKQLERAYASLPPVQRIVHVLHYFYGFTDSDLEEMLAISKSNSRELIGRASAALRRAFETNVCTPKESTGDEQPTSHRGLTIPGGTTEPNRVASHENAQLEIYDTSNVQLLVDSILKNRLFKAYDEGGFNGQEGASLRALEANDAEICLLIAKEAAA